MVRRFFFGGAARARSGDKKGAAFAGGDVFLARFVRVLAERAGQRAAGFRDVAQAAHGFAHQRHGRNAEMRRQGTIRAHNLPSLIVHHDVIADRVDVFDPLLLRTLQLRKAPHLFHRPAPHSWPARQAAARPLAENSAVARSGTACPSIRGRWHRSDRTRKTSRFLPRAKLPGRGG